MLIICAFLTLGPRYAEAEEGLASWYGPGFEGKPTASGAPFDPNGFTAASRTLPLGTRLLVSYGEHSVSVTVNDRGPLVAGRDLDLSEGAARALGLTKDGVGQVDWRLADPSTSQGVGPQKPLAPQGPALKQPDLLQGVMQPSDSAQGVASQWPSIPQAVTQQPDLAQGMPQRLGLEQGAGNPLERTKVGVGYAEDWKVGDLNFPQGIAQQPLLPQGAALWPGSSQQAAQEATGGGDYLVQPGDTLSGIASRFGTSVDNLASSNGIADLDFIRGGQALHLGANGGEPNFIRGQEGFRLDGYVPNPGLSRSGVTVGTGVDVGQSSASDIEALAIPQELKQKLVPYAGRIGQDAVNFLNAHPLHLTEEEANILDRVVTQDTIEGVARRFNAADPGNSFTNLPPQTRKAITDIAYQYGPDLGQRMPNFWGDLTQRRWNSVIEKLRNFGDRYPSRRNAEADLLQGATGGGDLRDYVVRPGDTLSEVASRLGTSVDHLMKANGIVDPNIIYGGQALHY